MYKPTEEDIAIYAMTAEIGLAYHQPGTSQTIAELAELWAREFPLLSEEQLCDMMVEFTRMNVREMNWDEDDIDGVTWFLGIHARAILKAGLSNSSVAIMTATSLRKYFNLI